MTQAPPSGMAMMLKSFGIDPAQLTGAVDKIASSLLELNTRLGAIEEQQRQIIALLGGHAESLVEIRRAVVLAGIPR